MSLTYDDIILEPRYSNIKTRNDVSLRTKLIGDIYLNLPIISANMDTITEDRMAITMALNGGVGIIHRYCSIDDQVSMVNSVKRFTSFIIREPYVLNEYDTVKQALELSKKTKINTFPVIGKNDEFIGLLTKKDYQFEKTDVNITKLISKTLKIEGNLHLSKKILIDKMNELKTDKLVIVDKNNKLYGLVTSKDILLKRSNEKMTLDIHDRLVCGAAIGVNGDYLKRAYKLIGAGVDFLCIDVAHGHSEAVAIAIGEIKRISSNILVMAGNVCTTEGVKFLTDAGADAIKCGVGAGSICSTRIMTGCGVPQLTAVMNCSKKSTVPIIADGGHQGKIGNMFKALSLGGASACMLGKFLSGTDETPGEIIYKDNKKFKLIRGMASYTANYSKSIKTDSKMNITHAEGTEFLVDYRGSVNEILNSIRGGLASGMSYLGVSNMDELKKLVLNNELKYHQITQNGFNESLYHD